MEAEKLVTSVEFAVDHDYKFKVSFLEIEDEDGNNTGEIEPELTITDPFTGETASYPLDLLETVLPIAQRLFDLMIKESIEEIKL
jgi:hypothetical protein